MRALVGEELGEQGELLVVPHDRGEWRGWLDVPATLPEDRAPIGLPGPSEGPSISPPAVPKF